MSPTSPIRITAVAVCIMATSPLAAARQEQAESQPARPSCAHLCTRQIDQSVKDVGGGILLRELYRQALLIAARDELGLATRDMTLRESIGADTPAGVRVLDLEVRVIADVGLALALRAGYGEDSPVVWRTELPMDVVPPVGYPELVGLAEDLSRDRFVAALRAAGLTGSALPQRPSATLPASAEKRLRRMSFIPQYAALREVHGHIRAGGESAELLGGLVRGYANLGQLTSFHWNASYKAFMARALLYAERMVAASPDAPESYWHRAYARALAGLHAAALSDLAEGERLARAGRAATAPGAPGIESWPPWIEPIEAYCRFETDRLSQIARAQGAHAELAAFLACLTMRQSSSHSITIGLLEEMLEFDPRCFAAYDALRTSYGLV